MKLSSCAICACGLVRAENQDNIYINDVYREDLADNSPFRHADTSEDRGIYAVADGMGGGAHGELAALVAVRALDMISHADERHEMANYLIERNDAICDLIKRNGGARMGSTFVGICVNRSSAVFANIGDSRIYLYRGGQLTQLSRDHNAAQRMVDLGVLTREAARKHPEKHVLTQHLGIFPSEMIIEPYTECVTVEDGDVFLLCSDGLTDMLDDGEIKGLLGSPGSIGERAEALYEEALRNGGKDNVSVLLVLAEDEVY
jgi:protein phosphatase